MESDEERLIEKIAEERWNLIKDEVKAKLSADSKLMGAIRSIFIPAYIQAFRDAVDFAVDLLTKQKGEL